MNGHKLIIRSSRLSDVNNLYETMREKDKIESIKLGFNPKVALTYSYRNALYRQTALIDGQVSAMWGVVGSALSHTGNPYLVTSTHVTEISTYKFVGIYKKEVQEMLKLFPVLENYVDGSYIESVRLLKLIGFTIGEPDNRGFYKFSINKGTV